MSKGMASLSASLAKPVSHLASRLPPKWSSVSPSCFLPGVPRKKHNKMLWGMTADML